MVKYRGLQSLHANEEDHWETDKIRFVNCWQMGTVTEDRGTKAERRGPYLPVLQSGKTCFPRVYKGSSGNMRSFGNINGKWARKTQTNVVRVR